MTVSDSKLETYIDALAEETTPDVANDMLLLLDVSTGGMKKIKPSTVAAGTSAGIGADGWADADAMTYAAADAPTFTMTCAGDQTGKYSVGMRVKLTQTTVKYFIITAVAYSSSTTITLYGGTDYTLANAAITTPYYSSFKAPLGFPLNPTKWEAVQTNAEASLLSSSPTANVWYNTGSISLVVPIGAWMLSMKAVGNVYSETTADKSIYMSLSTANNSESDADMTCATNTYGSAAKVISVAYYMEKPVVLASKTTFYPVLKTSSSGQTALQLENNTTKMVIRARCAYL